MLEKKKSIPFDPIILFLGLSPYKVHLSKNKTLDTKMFIASILVTVVN